MVLELIIPGLGILAISGAVGAVVYYLSMKKIETTVNEINETQDMRDKRIRDAIKETLVSDLDKIKAEEIKIRDTIEDSASRMKQIELEKSEFKKEVANHLREQLKEELGSRLRDSMARTTQVSDEQNRLEEMINNTKNDVKGGVLHVTNKLSSLKEETRRVEEKFVEIQDMFHKLSSRKDEIGRDIMDSIRKEGLKDVYSRMSELDTQVKLTKDSISQMEKDRDFLVAKLKNFDAVVPHMVKSAKEEVLTQVKTAKETTVRDNKMVKEDIQRLWKENKKLNAEVKKLKKINKTVRKKKGK